MATIITGSPNVSLFEIKIIADLCEGKFFIDLSPTVFIGDGANNILGVRVKLTNPLGVILKNYPTTGYDIEGGEGIEDIIEVFLPTEAGNYQYGNYIINAILYDEDAEYALDEPKQVYVDNPDPKNKTKKFAVIGASIKGLCKDGKVNVRVNTPPNYRGKIVESQENDFTLTYPGGSNLDSLETNKSSFSAPLFLGEYKIAGEICATYNYGYNVFAEVKYKLNYKKSISCILNYECIGIQLAGLLDSLDKECTDEEKYETHLQIARINGLVSTIEYLTDYNQDASAYISKLESLLNCSCICEGLEGTPIINNSPANDYTFSGCGFNESTSGLTKNIELFNYDYAFSLDENNVLSFGSPTVEGCTKTFPVVFNLANILIAALAKFIANNGLNITPDENGNKVIQLGGDVIKNTLVKTKSPYSLTFDTDFVNNYIKLFQREVDIVNSPDGEILSVIRSVGSFAYMQQYNKAEEISASQGAEPMGFYSKAVVKTTYDTDTPTDAGSVLIGIHIPESSDPTMYPLPPLDPNKSGYIQTSQNIGDGNKSYNIHYAFAHVFTGMIRPNASAGVINKILGVDATGTIVTNEANTLATYNTSTPTVAPTVNAGTGATATLVAGSNSTRGTVLLTTGSSPAGGSIGIFRLTFGTAYSVSPFVIVAPANNVAVTARVFCSFGGATTTYFDVIADAGVTASTGYYITYIVSK